MIKQHNLNKNQTHKANLNLYDKERVWGENPQIGWTERSKQSTNGPGEPTNEPFAIWPLRGDLLRNNKSSCEFIHNQAKTKGLPE